MREALARSDFDAVRRSPAPPRARRATGGTRARDKGRASAGPGAGAVAGRLLTAALALIGGLLLALVQLAFRALERWPVSVVGGLLGIALSAAIIVNAVSLQEGTHPSPLFGARSTESAARSTATRPDPLPPRRSADASDAAPPAAATQAPAPAPPRKASAQPAPAQPAPAPAAADPIAHLLATGAPPASGGAATGGVLGVQKALVKLGYDIVADGLNGPATRQAISAFEKLEGLPVTGDPANAAMREALAVATGAALD